MKTELVCLNGSIRKEIRYYNRVTIDWLTLSETVDELVSDNTIREIVELNGDTQVTKEKNGCK